MGSCPVPVPETSVGIDSLHPFVQIASFNLVLLHVLPFGLQDEHFAISQPYQEVRPVFAHHAAIDVQNLKPQVVILCPGHHMLAVVQHKGVRCLPGAVINADVDMRFLCPLAGLTSEPSSHFARGADGMVAVEHGCQAFGVLLPHRFPDMLYYSRHIQGDDQATTKLVLIEPVSYTHLTLPTIYSV